MASVQLQRQLEIQTGQWSVQQLYTKRRRRWIAEKWRKRYNTRNTNICITNEWDILFIFFALGLALLVYCGRWTTMCVYVFVCVLCIFYETASRVRLSVGHLCIFPIRIDVKIIRSTDANLIKEVHSPFQIGLIRAKILPKQITNAQIFNLSIDTCGDWSPLFTAIH